MGRVNHKGPELPGHWVCLLTVMAVTIGQGGALFGQPSQAQARAPVATPQPAVKKPPPDPCAKKATGKTSFYVRSIQLTPHNAYRATFSGQVSFRCELSRFYSVRKRVVVKKPCPVGHGGRTGSTNPLGCGYCRGRGYIKKVEYRDVRVDLPPTWVDAKVSSIVVTGEGIARTVLPVGVDGSVKGTVKTAEGYFFQAPPDEPNRTVEAVDTQLTMRPRPLPNLRLFVKGARYGAKLYRFFDPLEYIKQKL